MCCRVSARVVSGWLQVHQNTRQTSRAGEVTSAKRSFTRSREIKVCQIERVRASMYVHAQNRSGRLRSPRPRNLGGMPTTAAGMFCAYPCLAAFLVPRSIRSHSRSHGTWGQAHPSHPAGTRQPAWHTWCPSDRWQSASRRLARIKRGGAASGAVRDSVLPVPNRRGSPTKPVPKRWHRRGNSSSNHSAPGSGGDRAGAATGRGRGHLGVEAVPFWWNNSYFRAHQRPSSHLRQRDSVWSLARPSTAIYKLPLSMPPAATP